MSQSTDDQRLIDYFAEIAACLDSISGALRHRQQPQDYHFHTALKACRDGTSLAQSHRAAAGREEVDSDAAREAVRGEVGSILCTWKDHKGRTCRGGESFCLCKQVADAVIAALKPTEG